MSSAALEVTLQIKKKNNNPDDVTRPLERMQEKHAKWTMKQGML